MGAKIAVIVVVVCVGKTYPISGRTNDAVSWRWSCYCILFAVEKTTQEILHKTTRFTVTLSLYNSTLQFRSFQFILQVLQGTTKRQTSETMSPSVTPPIRAPKDIM